MIPDDDSNTYIFFKQTEIARVSAALEKLASGALALEKLLAQQQGQQGAAEAAAATVKM